ncbi:MAG: hypothetical protein Fur005_19070 [Roseiflexaceae bacterium]
MHQHHRTGVLLLAGSLVLCSGLALALLLTTPRRFLSHRETVAYVLEQQQIGYQQISFTQTIEERSNFDLFSASVRVVLSDGSIAEGAIGCEERDRRCLIDLHSLGLRGVRLPELSRRTPLPAWLAWAERPLGKLWRW